MVQPDSTWDSTWSRAIPLHALWRELVEVRDTTDDTNAWRVHESVGWNYDIYGVQSRCSVPANNLVDKWSGDDGKWTGATVIDKCPQCRRNTAPRNKTIETTRRIHGIDVPEVERDTDVVLFTFTDGTEYGIYDFNACPCSRRSVDISMAEDDLRGNKFKGFIHHRPLHPVSGSDRWSLDVGVVTAGSTPTPTPTIEMTWRGHMDSGIIERAPHGDHVHYRTNLRAFYRDPAHQLAVECVRKDPFRLIRMLGTEQDPDTLMFLAEFVGRVRGHMKEVHQAIVRLIHHHDPIVAEGAILGAVTHIHHMFVAAAMTRSYVKAMTKSYMNAMAVVKDSHPSPMLRSIAHQKLGELVSFLPRDFVPSVQGPR